MHPLALSLILSTTPAVGVTAANCANPNVPAAVSDVPLLGGPSIASAAGEGGVTEFRITLGSNPGRPQRVFLERSSGLLAVDDVAMQTAMNTVFTPEIQGCTAVAGEYFYEVET